MLSPVETIKKTFYDFTSITSVTVSPQHKNWLMDGTILAINLHAHATMRAHVTAAAVANISC